MSRKIIIKSYSKMLNLFNKDYDLITESSLRKQKDKSKYIIYKLIDGGIMFKTNIKSDYSPQNIAFSMYDEKVDKEDYYLIKDEINGKNWYGFILKNTLHKNIEKYECIYEILRTEHERKIYGDIEYKCDEPNEENEKKYMEAVKLFKNTILRFLPEAEFADCEGNAYSDLKKTKYKYSRHVIVKNYYVDFEYQQKYASVLKKLNNPIIDTCVYSRNRVFKLPFQWKNEDRNRNLVGRKQKPLGKWWDIRDFLIQNIEYAEPAYDEFRHIKVEKKPLKEKLHIRKSTRPAPKFKNLTTENVYRVMSSIDPNCMDFMSWRFVISWCKNKGIPFEAFKDHFNAPFKGQEGNNVHINKWRSLYKNTKRNNGINTNNHIRLILHKQYGEIVETEKKEFLEQFITEDNAEGEQVLIPYNRKHLNEKDFQHLDTKYKLFTCSLGYGKTFTNLRYISKLVKEGKRTIIICNRIALKYDIIGTAKDKHKLEVLDYKDYNDGTPLPKGGYCLLTTLESLRHFGINCYDLVLIDEIESVYDILRTYATLKEEHYEYTTKQFFKLLRTAKKVHLLDALMMKRTYRFIRDIESDIKIESIADEIYDREEKQPLISNIITKNKNKQDRWIKWYKNDSKTLGVFNMIQDMIKLIKDGEKLYIYYPHKIGRSSGLKKKGIDALMEILCSMGDIDINDCCVHASGRENNEKLCSVEAYWSNKKIVMNTNISTGVSYSPKNDFHSVWLINDSAFISPRTIIQTSSRIREPKEPCIRYTNMRRGESQQQFVIPMMTQIYGNVYYGVDSYNNEYQLDKRDRTTLRNLFQDLRLEFELKDDEVVIGMFNKINIEVKQIVNPNRKTTNANKKIFEKAVKDNESSSPFEFDNIEDIDLDISEEYKLLEKQGKLYDYQDLRLKKFLLKQKFHKDTPEDVLEYFWKNQKLTRAFFKLLKKPGHVINDVFSFDKMKLEQQIYNCKKDLENLNDEQKKEEEGEVCPFTDKYITLNYNMNEISKTRILMRLNMRKYGNNNDICKKTIDFYFGLGLVIYNKKDFKYELSDKFYESLNLYAIYSNIMTDYEQKFLIPMTKFQKKIKNPNKYDYFMGVCYLEDTSDEEEPEPKKPITCKTKKVKKRKKSKPDPFSYMKGYKEDFDFHRLHFRRTERVLSGNVL